VLNGISSGNKSLIDNVISTFNFGGSNE
jgi:hypothetical protein